MTEHTPGPWEASPPLEGRCQWNITAGGPYDPSKGARRRIGFVGNTAAPRILPDLEANARLIAAAPDLLEALEQAVKIIKEHVPIDALGIDSSGDLQEAHLTFSWPILEEHLHYMGKALAKAKPLEQEEQDD